MKTTQRTTISVYGNVYNELARYKKEKEQQTGYRLSFPQALALMLKEIGSAKTNQYKGHE